MVLNFAYGIHLPIIHVSKLLPFACNFLSIGCDFTWWGLDGDRIIETEYPIGYASSGGTLFRDTGTKDLDYILSFFSLNFFLTVNPALLQSFHYGSTTIRLRTFRLRHFVYRHFVYYCRPAYRTVIHPTSVSANQYFH